MKTKALRILVVILMIATIAEGQEFKVAKNTGKLVFNSLNNLTIEGYGGNEIVFTSLDGNSDRDRRAEGLRAINGLGLEDNTGFGLSVQDKGNTVEVFQLKGMGGPRVKVMVPKGVSISINHNSPYGDRIRMKNVESEIEISTLHSGVELDNVTGPMTIKTIHGQIEAVFGANIKSPISIASIHGLIDITVPSAVKANISMSTSHGEIFVDPAIKIEQEEKSDMVRYGSSKVSGKVNGGGIEISLSTSHSNIYLRKK